jgi:glucosamine-6-phosphate deaminase
MTLRLVIHSDHEAVSQALAKDLSDLIRLTPRARMAWPSGQSPVRAYELLAEQVQAGRLDCQGLTLFALDEYLGLPAADPRSFANFFARHVFDPLGIPKERAGVLRGDTEDPLAELSRYERQIAADGGLALSLLGLGANGHIAFNEPAEALRLGAHVAQLQAPANAIAPFGLTLGIGALLGPSAVWLLATGASKATAVTQMLSGTLDPRWPASCLQLHQNVTFYLDEAAAAQIPASMRV